MEDKSPNAESNIVYLGIDVAHGHKMPEAMGQLNLFRGKDIKAVFCDIRHTPNQTPFAMQLRAEMQRQIEMMWPLIKQKDKNICIRLNIEGARTFKARDTMYKAINTYKEQGAAKNVKYRDPEGRDQGVEY